jgi:acyl-CoA thioesterase
VSAHPFDVETAVEPAGEHLWRARTTREHWFGGGAHGGHLGATLLRALAAEVGDPELAPRSLTVHFATRPEEGELEIRVAIERRGGSVVTAGARMTQGGRLIALALAAFGRRRPGPSFVEEALPEFPPPEEARAPSERASSQAPAALRDYELRFAVGVPFAGGPARTGGWIRTRDPRLVDAPMAFNLADIWMPAVFMRLREPEWVPTIELTVNFLSELPIPGARPDDWYAVMFEAPAAEGGYWREEGSVWSREGRLLARSSQLSVFLPRSG